jgi:hypothetical protein
LLSGAAFTLPSHRSSAMRSRLPITPCTFATLWRWSNTHCLAS